MNKFYKVFFIATLLFCSVAFLNNLQAQSVVATVDNSADCGNNGCATATITGGTAPYDYVWYDVATNSPFPPTNNSPFSTNQKCNLPAADYYCEVTDDFGNIFLSDTVTIANDAPQLGTFASSAISCNGYSDGELQAFAFNGSGNYTFTWSDDPQLSNILSTSPILSNASAGTYFVELNDLGGSCVDTFPVLLSEPAPIIITLDFITDINCANDGNGAINVSTSGPGTLNYLWEDDQANPVSNSEDLIGVSGGIYTLIVSNASGCSDTLTDTINEPLPLVITLIDSSNVTCHNFSDGEIQVDISGGTGNQLTSWVGPSGFTSPNEDILGLECGQYDLNVTDNVGCTATFFHQIPCPTPININVDSVVDVSCNGLSDGEIFISASGGTPSVNGYDYNWSSTSGFSANIEDISLAPAGSYVVEVQDSNSCILTQTVDINQPALLDINAINIIDASCFGSSDGSVRVRVDGGTPDYTLSLYDASLSFISDSSFNASPGLVTIIDYPVVGAGSYTFIAVDSNNCQSTFDTLVGQPTEIVITLDSAFDVSCLGAADAEIYVSVTGGEGNYNYSWNGPSCNTCAAEDITNLSGGVYNLVVTDMPNSCTQTFSHNALVPPALTVSIDSLITVTCRDSIDGIIAVTATGGTSPYSYAWTGPGGYTNNDSIGFGLDVGNYNISITDFNNCSTSLPTQLMTQPSNPLTSVFITDSVICFGESNGQIESVVSGGTSPYFWHWSSGDSISNPNTFSAGDYTVEISDIRGCLYLDTLTVLEPDNLLANLLQIEENCGQTDGQVIANTTGGTQPYAYSWNSDPAETTNILSNLDGGTFIPEIVTITDANNCQVTDQITVQEAAPVSLAGSSISHISCYLGSDGGIQVSIAGGVHPYSYSWFHDFGAGANPPISNQNILNDTTLGGLSAGDYILSVTDNTGCQEVFNFTISETQTAALTASLNTNQSFLALDCFADNDAQIVVNVSGGTPFPGPHYEYILNGVQQSQLVPVFAGLNQGSYQLIVTDNNGCTDTVNTVVNEPTEIQTTLSQNSVNCFGGSDASVTAVTIGGTPNYSFDWSTGFQENTSGSSTISNLSTNTYTLTITDDNGCVDTASIVVVQPQTALDLTVDYVNETCREEDGSASVLALGGTPGYSYSWTYDYDQLLPIYTSLNVPNPSATTPNLSDVYNGWYFVTVTDTNGCIEKDSVLIGLDSSPEIQASTPIHPLCYGYMTGQVSVFAINGNPDYEFAVDGFDYDIDQVFTGLGHGQHYFTVRDSLGCIDTAYVDIVEPDAVLADSMIVINTTCNGDSDGSITAFISGGTITNNYIYEWYNPNGGPAYPANPTGVLQTITGLNAGIYTLNVTDDNGCEYSTTAEVNQPLAVSANAFVTSNYNNADVTCFGSCDGSVQVIPGGGTAPYEYIWSSGSTSDTAQGLCADVYTVEVLDSNSCSFITTVEVGQPSEVQALILNSNVVHVNCLGWETGEAIVSVNGGITTATGYTYFWSDINDLTTPLSLTETVTGLGIGTYQVSVTDLNGCNSIGTVVINDNNQLTINPTVTDVSCYGFNDGQAQLGPSGGVQPYSHSWSDPLNQQTELADFLQPGWYTDTIYDAEGCEIIDSVLVNQPAELEITGTSVNEITCYNASDGSIEIQATGGVLFPFGYQYSIDCNNWVNANNIITGLNSGSYTVCVRDRNGCVDDEVNIIVPAQPNELVIVNLQYNDISCDGLNDGSANVNVQGGTTPLAYSWSNSQTSTSATSFGAGLQNITIVDDNGCTVSESFIINNPDPILVDSFVVDNYCAYAQDATISVYANGGTGVLTYYYDNVLSPDYEINGLTVGLYDISVQDANGCINPFIVNIPDPNLIAFNEVTICQGDSLVLDAASVYDTFSSYLWSPATSTSSSIVVSPSQTTSYIVSAWDNTCYSVNPFIDTIPITVNVPVIDAGDEVGIVRGESATLMVSGDPIYSWSTGEFTQQITVAPLVTTYYMASAVDPSNGCIGYDSVRVFVGMNEGFSPNGDDYNETWQVSYLNNYEGATVAVFNRWGGKIWESSYPSIENWDGTYNGNPVPSGTYYYIVSFSDNEKESLTGPITILR